MTRLPPFPWDRLAPFTQEAATHPGGAVNLSIGTPVDPVPDAIRAALTAAADRPGYPLTAGTAQLREAMADWVRRHCGATGEPGVLPTIGSKEIVAGLPRLLGVGAGDAVAIPRLSYPTYEVGALLADARPVRTDDPTADPDPRLRMIWVNHPSNPTGEVVPAERLRRIVDWARERDVVVVSDECYLTLGWDADQTSILDPAVCGPDPTGVLALHSLSKRSNLAGYRAGFVAGDPSLVARLLEIRKHAGLIVPTPVQSAMTAALTDESHARAQRDRYRRRRDRLAPALRDAGFRIDHSQAGLYLWTTRGEPCWQTVARLAARGIVVAPGEFYGPDGAEHVRVALTATDERIDTAVTRLAELA